MGVIINEDLSATIEREDGATCNLPAYNPETLQPWVRRDQVEEYIGKIQGDSRFFSKPEPKKYRKQLTPVEFKMLMTPQERIAVKTAAKAGDELLEDFLEVLNDPRLKTVDLDLEANKQAMAYLVSLGILTQERAEVILTGMEE